MAYMQAEAPAGYDNLTNGHTPQDAFNENMDLFNEHDGTDEGLGPTFNQDACGACHNQPVSGAGSHLTELRAGSTDGAGNFTDHVGGSLLHTNCVAVECTEHARGADNTFAERISLSTLGDGFIEAIANGTITANQAAQPAGQRGSIAVVPLLEVPGATRVGRFGHKAQQASLLSFSADAYLNEMGITSVLQPTENTSDGNSVADFDETADPEDEAVPGRPFGNDVGAFTDFMRSTKVPPRGPVGASEANGSNLFDAIGCAVCHTRTFTTAQPGTAINGGQTTVSAALGNRVIHPFSDFLLHNIGTGDGIVQNAGAGSRNQMRTTPLWGLRARNRFIHDGNSFTASDAINRHAGQATAARNNFNSLTAGQRQDVLNFLFSL